MGQDLAVLQSVVRVDNCPVLSVGMCYQVPRRGRLEGFLRQKELLKNTTCIICPNHLDAVPGLIGKLLEHSSLNAIMS